MLPRDIVVTKNDITGTAWNTIIEGCKEKTCEAYADAFFARAKAERENTNLQLSAAFTLLGDVAGLHMRAESPDEPFGPMMVMGNTRSAIVSDFTSEHIKLFQELLPDMADPEFRARIADVVWVSARDIVAGQLAVKSYLESARRLEDPDMWPPCFERIERAVRLAASLGKGNDSFKQTIQYVKDVLDRCNGEDPLYLSGKLMELLLDHSPDDPAKYAALAEKMAAKSRGLGQHDREAYYQEICARWHQKLGNQEKANAAKVSSAETHVRMADGAMVGPNASYLRASHFLEEAIEAYRRLGMTTKVAELHQRLLGVQEKSMGEMKPITAEVPIGDLADRAIAEVKAKTFKDALFSLALLVKPTDVIKIKARTEEHIKKFPLQHFIEATYVNNAGKVIARTPSAITDDDQEREAGLESRMFWNAHIDYGLEVQAAIEPARAQINLEHPCRLDDLAFIVRSNPFIPADRIRTFAKGLQYGLWGDWSGAAHFLVPQIENSIRYTFYVRGIITSKYDAEGIQEEYSLNKLFENKRKELLEIFGEDILFDLRCLLSERTGANLRNSLAHGLINDNGFYSVNICYLWWLVLHLVCLPRIAQEKKE